MKKILIIFVLALSAQVAFAQLYSTAEHEEYTKKTLGLGTSLSGSNITFGNTTHAPSTRTFFVQPSSYTQQAWKGETYAVGEAMSNATPVMRREGGFPPETPEVGTVPLGNAPWLLILLLVGGYALITYRKQRA